jgi:N-carbamoyl-L-amino-acid hydrolase
MQADSSNVVATPADFRIDGGRERDSLTHLARIGATDKVGICRLALTEVASFVRTGSASF